MLMTLDFGREPAFANILSALDQGVAVFSKDRTLLFTNAEMKRLTGGRNGAGWSLNELIQRHQLRNEEGVAIDTKDFPIERAFRGEESRNEIFEYIAPTGIHVWLSVSCMLIKEAEEVTYVVTTVSDITEKKRREDKLRFMIESAKILSLTTDFRERLRQKAKLAVPSLADWCAIDILNDKDEIERVMVVHRDPEMLQYVIDFEKKYPSDPDAPGSVKSVIESSQPLFVPIITEEMLRAGSQSEQHLQDIKKLSLSSVMTIPIDARGKSLGAMTLAYAESGRVYTDDDLQFFREFCHHLGVLLDNARLYDEISARDKAKDLFLASLSHELRNPLAPIRSALELLSFKNLRDDVREELNIISHQFDHMAKLLNDLLDATRFTSGKMAIAPKKSELTHLVQRALKSSESFVRGADISLATHFPPGSIYVEVDDTRLEQAVQNLISNAAKFTPAGGSISVEIRADDSSAYVSVTDSGAGISTEELPRIFDMYYQGKNEGGVNSGLGIGLPLVKRIAEMHGGSVEATSPGIGRGSTFTLKLPRSQVEPTADETIPVPEQEGKKNISVLIVDDNVPAADALVKLLTKIGMKARALYSAADTLSDPDIAKEDVVLLDIGMPDMDGYEVVKQLRMRGVRQPVIALTGYGLSSDVKRAMDAGFSSHLTKPVGLKELRQVFSDIHAR